MLCLNLDNGGNSFSIHELVFSSHSFLKKTLENSSSCASDLTTVGEVKRALKRS